MADFMSPAQRSAHMSKIRSKDTVPELTLRKMLHSMGYRYRLHDKRLPGKPDLVFTARKKVIFVNGCFWHGHACSVGSRLPKTNSAFWAEKRRRNRERDVAQRRLLTDMGWTFLDVWECEISSADLFVEPVVSFLGVKSKPVSPR